MVRGEILEQILNRVVTKATAPVSHIMGMKSDTFVMFVIPPFWLI